MPQLPGPLLVAWQHASLQRLHHSVRPVPADGRKGSADLLLEVRWVWVSRRPCSLLLLLVRAGGDMDMPTLLEQVPLVTLLIDC